KDLDQWGISHYYTYILISTDFSMDFYKEKLPQFIEKYKGKKALDLYNASYPLQPLTGIHLHSHMNGEIEPNRLIETVYLFSAIAMVILLIACLNYINLSTAGYVNRAKEVGLRKILGATRPQLIRQFLGESFLYALIAFSIAVFLAELFLPAFNSLSGKRLAVHYFGDPFIAAGLIGIVLCVGLVSGTAPALFITMFPSVQVSKGVFKIKSRHHRLRSPLVLFQFAVSIVFIIAAGVTADQLNYMKTRRLGFDKEHIINIPIYSKEALEKYETVKSELLKYSGIRDVCASNFFPGKNIYNMNYRHEGVDVNEAPLIACTMVDYDFLNTFGIKLVEGRNFSKQFQGDIDSAYILNRSAVHEFGWTSAVGKDFSIGNRSKGTVIGVVEDFHFESLHKEIKPLVLFIFPRSFSYFSIRTNPGNISPTLQFLKNR
ncbi:MAG: FtsX-like permease family protein, partial [Candidatus Aminicenantes bacterium]|nr:FtsX-like permease family protein [Candidatus Aminicenantes bacterium]